jgi:hypothetical protein
LYKPEAEARHDFCYETMEGLANGDPFKESPLAIWLTIVRPTCLAIVFWYANKEFDLPRTLDWDVFTSTPPRPTIGGLTRCLNTPDRANLPANNGR